MDIGDIVPKLLRTVYIEASNNGTLGHGVIIRWFIGISNNTGF